MVIVDSISLVSALKIKCLHSTAIQMVLGISRHFGVLCIATSEFTTFPDQTCKIRDQPKFSGYLKIVHYLHFSVKVALAELPRRVD